MKHRDSKQQFETGAQRDDATLKGRPSLISPVATYRKAIHLEKGEQHYGSRNWEKGMPFSRCADSLIRHIIQWLAGDKSEDHLAAIGCNVDFLMHYEAAIAAGKLPSDLDDRPDHSKILENYLTSLEPQPKLECPGCGGWMEQNEECRHCEFWDALERSTKVPERVKPVIVKYDPTREWVCWVCQVAVNQGHRCSRCHCTQQEDRDARR